MTVPRCHSGDEAHRGVLNKFKYSSKNEPSNHGNRKPDNYHGTEATVISLLFCPLNVSFILDASFFG